MVQHRTIPATGRCWAARQRSRSSTPIIPFVPLCLCGAPPNDPSAPLCLCGAPPNDPGDGQMSGDEPSLPLTQGIASGAAAPSRDDMGGVRSRRGSALPSSPLCLCAFVVHHPTIPLRLCVSVVHHPTIPVTGRCRAARQRSRSSTPIIPFVPLCLCGATSNDPGDGQMSGGEAALSLLHPHHPLRAFVPLWCITQRSRRRADVGRRGSALAPPPPSSPLCLCAFVVHHPTIPLCLCGAPPSHAYCNPNVSGHPSIRFIFCTAWPDAPFTRLSITATRIARPGSTI